MARVIFWVDWTDLILCLIALRFAMFAFLSLRLEEVLFELVDLLDQCFFVFGGDFVTGVKFGLNWLGLGSEILKPLGLELLDIFVVYIIKQTIVGGKNDRDLLGQESG
jgi:hypothetical protein